MIGKRYKPTRPSSNVFEVIAETDDHVLVASIEGRRRGHRRIDPEARSAVTVPVCGGEAVMICAQCHQPITDDQPVEFVERDGEDIPLHKGGCPR